MLQVLDQWTQTSPACCQIPGLLPLQTQEDVWTWRETVVIQAMALEAAHQLVETLPLESLESLEVLLGLEDGLVEDSSRVDPRGFERVTLGLPILPEGVGYGVDMTAEMDPARRRLPQITVQFCPQSPVMIDPAQLLSHWIWALTQQFGPEVSYGGLVLLQAMAQADRPWQSAIALTGTEVLQRMPSPDAHAHALKIWARRLALLGDATVQWEERRLDWAQVTRWSEPVWQMQPIETRYGLQVEGGNGAAHYGRGPMQEFWLQVAPGRWCERLIDGYGEGTIQALRALSQVAGQLLTIDPIQQRLGAKLGLFIAYHCWQGQGATLTVGELLEAVDLMERVQSLGGPSMRRDAFFQDWATGLEQLRQLGWMVTDDPLQGWETAADSMDWLTETLTIQVLPQAMQPQTVAVSTVTEKSRHPDGAPPSPRRMDKISSRALEKALATRGMSQAKLARLLELDRSTINRWINGSRPIHARYRPLLWEMLGEALEAEDGEVSS